MTIAVANWTTVLLEKIANHDLHQREVAQAYACAIRSTQFSDEFVDWPRVNKAIMSRWSRSGLERIKRMAWSGRCFE